MGKRESDFDKRAKMIEKWAFLKFLNHRRIQNHY